MGNKCNEGSQNRGIVLGWNDWEDHIEDNSVQKEEI